jgi:pathogenesis-related protein 1
MQKLERARGRDDARPMRLRWASLAIVLVSCGGDDPPPAVDAPSEPSELAGIMQRHNDVRAMVSTADPLPPLVWSPQLAATASAWIAMCSDQLAPAGLIDHNTDRSNGHPYYVGENIFGAGGTPDFGTVEKAVTQWASEGANYDYASNTCNGTCGHYTQLVWRATRELGCAVRDCPSLTYRASLVCNYGPGGNLGSDRPY